MTQIQSFNKAIQISNVITYAVISHGGFIIFGGLPYQNGPKSGGNPLEQFFYEQDDIGKKRLI